ncbi:MAG: ATP-binding protein, partial [Gammaproteobacteria bacterium]|nr:ATP-binding protein [Gammaproteobacteria bacterium]
VCEHLSGGRLLGAHGAPAVCADGGAVRGASAARLDLADVRGQAHAKRALLIAAAGAHSLLLIGPPGCGKSMLAQRLPGLLPPLTESEALEVASIAAVSAAGFGGAAHAVRPFRAPHHSTTVPALVGGGARARPGEVSLAHRGVLFLDELPEFGRGVLEALREPLETGVIQVARAALQTQYPAEFQLIAAMNPCPCGGRGDPQRCCRCTPALVRRYHSRLSGPLLDRLDLQVEVPRLAAEEFDAPPGAAPDSATAAQLVDRARALQLGRAGLCNARLAEAQAGRWCVPDPAGRRVLETAMRRFKLSGRARSRVLRVARTIADLEERPVIGAAHVGEALTLRCLDRAAPGG